MAVDSEIEVKPEQLVPTVLENWDRIGAPQLEQLARQLWRCARDARTVTQIERGDADAAILMALKDLKLALKAQSLHQFAKIRDAMLMGSDTDCVSGFIHAEGSKHYKKAAKFIEQRLMMPLLDLIDKDMGGAIATAAKYRTPTERYDAYERISERLTDVLDKLEFSTIDLERKLQPIQDKLTQLMDREEQQS